MFLKFQWYTFFPYQDIKQEVLLRSYLDSSSLFNHPLSHVRQEKKRGKDENTKFEYLKNKICLLDKVKSIFYNYSWVVIWCKTKNSKHKLSACYTRADQSDMPTNFLLLWMCMAAIPISCFQLKFS